MTLAQITSLSLIAGMMGLFVWGRFRYDVVAVIALLTGVFTGLIPHEKAFTGFSDSIVVIVASAFVVSAAVGRSGILEAALQWVSPYVSSVQMQITALVATVTLLSAFVKNIGAVAMMIPIAFQMARQSGIAPSCFLMPLAFGSLLGGLITQVGTSPNIVVSRIRQEISGQPFSMFDFAPVGLGVAIAGLAFLSVGYRLLPQRRASATIKEALSSQAYVTEARVVAGSSLIGQTVGDLTRKAANEISVTGIVRERSGRTTPLPDAELRENDILLLKGGPEALGRALEQAHLEMTGQHPEAVTPGSDQEMAAVEAVVGPTSLLIGQSARRMALLDRFNVQLIGVGRGGTPLSQRLRDIELSTGDVVLLRGKLTQLPERLRYLGCLPLAQRPIRLGSVRSALTPLAVLAVAMLVTAFALVPVSTAFFTAAALMVAFGSLSPREAYEAIDWPILVLLAALIPVSETISTTGASNAIAGWMAHAAASVPGFAAVALVLIAAMMVTPFLNNAATVLVMGPVAATFAAQLGYGPDAFLMAVAIGAGCDFLTPIGHQCNTLVMGPGGYKFGDYWKLGLPLSFIVVITAVPLIILVWPLR
jgi:di/tricarboxylate transporter